MLIDGSNSANYVIYAAETLLQSPREEHNVVGEALFMKLVPFVIETYEAPRAVTSLCIVLWRCSRVGYRKYDLFDIVFSHLIDNGGQIMTLQQVCRVSISLARLRVVVPELMVLLVDRLDEISRRDGEDVVRSYRIKILQEFSRLRK